MIELFECPPYLMFEHRSICSRILELYNVDNNLDIKYYIYNELSQKNIVNRIRPALPSSIRRCPILL